MGVRMIDSADQWSRVVAAATSPPRSGPQRNHALLDALGVGASITTASVGCSITLTTPRGFRTPAASSDLALTLDLAQYRADDGPCVAACRDGRVHSIVVMERETGFTGFTAAALALGVRSSLSIPLPDTPRPAALNLYASSTSAFETRHARDVAKFLSRCVAALIPNRARTELPGPAARADRAASYAAHEYVTQAMKILQAENTIAAAPAYRHLTQLSRQQHRSVIAIAQDIIAEAHNGASG